MSNGGPAKDFIIEHSEMRGGWCVYEQTSHAEYEVRLGPFADREFADSAMAEMLVAREVKP